jgi:hypothetical protein
MNKALSKLISGFSIVKELEGLFKAFLSAYMQELKILF